MDAQSDFCRPGSRLSPSDFTRKLSRYSALTVGGVVGTMAGFESAEAVMIVTNTAIALSDDPLFVPTVDINLNGVNGPASLLDGTGDVRITLATASLLEAQGLNGGLLAGTLGVNSFFYPTAFQAPSTVGPALGFSGNSSQALNSFGTLANGTSFGNWAMPSAVSGYLGLKFEINGNEHFGWVHITWDPTSDTALIDQYAYNGNAGAPALVPEPSTLTLLGLGALGLAARRRRKMS